MTKDVINNFYHSKTVAESLEDLNSEITGLSDKEASIRLARFGRNEIDAKEKQNPFLIFLKLLVRNINILRQ